MVMETDSKTKTKSRTRPTKKYIYIYICIFTRIEEGKKKQFVTRIRYGTWTGSALLIIGNCPRGLLDHLHFHWHYHSYWPTKHCSDHSLARPGESYALLLISHLRPGSNRSTWDNLSGDHLSVLETNWKAKTKNEVKTRQEQPGHG